MGTGKGTLSGLSPLRSLRGGCAHSEVMQEVFGPVDGVGVRSAVGMMLPHGIATEVECVF